VGCSKLVDPWSPTKRKKGYRAPSTTPRHFLNRRKDSELLRVSTVVAHQENKRCTPPHHILNNDPSKMPVFNRLVLALMVTFLPAAVQGEILVPMMVDTEPVVESTSQNDCTLQASDILGVAVLHFKDISNLFLHLFFYGLSINQLVYDEL